MNRHLLVSLKVVSVIALTLGVASISFSANSAWTARVDRRDEQGAQQEQPFDQTQALAELTKRIAGRENKPAEEVFGNIQMLKGVPAGRLLKVMELGYSKSLGVNCTHCHVAGQWEKDDKPTKQVTREMMKMVGAINNDYLKNIKNLKSEKPIVNCTTCHRGQVKPALNMP